MALSSLMFICFSNIELGQFRKAGEGGTSIVCAQLPEHVYICSCTDLGFKDFSNAMQIFSLFIMLPSGMQHGLGLSTRNLQRGIPYMVSDEQQLCLQKILVKPCLANRRCCNVGLALVSNSYSTVKFTEQLLASSSLFLSSPSNLPRKIALSIKVGREAILTALAKNIYFKMQ